MTRKFTHHIKEHDWKEGELFTKTILFNSLEEALYYIETSEKMVVKLYNEIGELIKVKNIIETEVYS